MNYTTNYQQTYPAPEKIRAQFAYGFYGFNVYKDFTLAFADQDNASVIFNQPGVTKAVERYRKWEKKNGLRPRKVIYTGF